LIETEYDGTQRVLTTEDFWASSEGRYERFTTTRFTWEDGLLVAEERPDWTASYEYSDVGRVLSVSRGTRGRMEVETWNWALSPDGDRATITGGDGFVRNLAWDAERRLCDEATWDSTVAWTWSADRAISRVVTYEDGQSVRTAYEYDADGRLERVYTDDVLTERYEWMCPSA
jgi:YD repeat-containing protein